LTRSAHPADEWRGFQMMAAPERLSHLSIQEMRIYRFDLPLKDRFTIATMSLSEAQNLLVER
jgi:hypothetical protein